MVRGRTSVLIPARQEPFLAPTVRDALAQARGEVEVIVVLEGYWPEPMLPDDSRVHILHWGAPQGLRPSLNAAVQMASGEFLFKLDAHCALGEGYDEILKAACGEADVVVPEKYSLDPVAWTRYRDPWHYYFYLWPWQPEKFVGLQDRNYGWEYAQPKLATRVDDILTYQGSAWMLRRSWWDQILPNGMDAARYYYSQEPVEVGLTTWVRGGRCRIVKDAWYAHLWKGKGEHRRQFKRLRQEWNDAMRWGAHYWMTHPAFPALIERFGPLPGWPADWPAEAARQWAT